MARPALWLMLAALTVLGCNSLFGVDGLSYDPTGAGGTAVGGAGGTGGGGGASPLGGSGGSSPGGAGGDGGGGGAPWVTAEQLDVPCDGTEVSSVMLLAEGVDYRLRASGTCVVNANINISADADWADFDDPRDFSSDGLIDIGIGVDDPVVDGTLHPKWGPFNLAHIYEIDFPGKGAALTARYHDPVYSNNSGAQQLEILAQQ